MCHRPRCAFVLILCNEDDDDDDDGGNVDENAFALIIPCKAIKQCLVSCLKFSFQNWWIVCSFELSIVCCRWWCCRTAILFERHFSAWFFFVRFFLVCSYFHNKSQKHHTTRTDEFSKDSALLLESINTEGIDARMVLEIAAKMKRMSEERSEPEPRNKKSKSEKIDMWVLVAHEFWSVGDHEWRTFDFFHSLFGSEDVDLRQLMNPAVLGPMHNSDGESTTKATVGVWFFHQVNFALSNESQTI